MDIAVRGILIAITIATTAWAIWAIAFRDKMKVYLKLRKLPQRTVATLVPGEPARLIGTARAVKLTEALYSKRECILYSMRLSDGGAGHDASAIGEDFELEDESGRVLVCGRGAWEVDLVEQSAGMVRDRERGASFGASVIARERFNAGTGGGVLFEDEGILGDGMRVAIGGLVMKDDDGTLRIVGNERSPVYVVDVRRHKALAKSG